MDPAGPGKAYTAREQAEMLFRLAGREPKYISVPVGFMDAIIGAMEFVGRAFPSVMVRAVVPVGVRFQGKNDVQYFHVGSR